MSREVPPGIVVLEGTDVAGAWDRFEIFEALHHGMRTCNPMLPDELDTILGRLDPAAGDRVLDIACGHGELLIRTGERAPIDGAGVDLSPWALVRAMEEAARRKPSGRLTWVLGDGKALPIEPWDIVSCLGASWIWNGFAGTARALAARCRPGAAMAIGDPVLKEGADPDAFADAHGRMPTLEQQAEALLDAGFGHLEALVVPDSSFDAYFARVTDSAESWARLHPGEKAERYLEEGRRWSQGHGRDREFLSWVVWTGRRTSG